MGGPIFLETSTPRERPRSVIELISLIQQYAAIEVYGAPAPSESLLLSNQSTFTYAGAKGGFGGMMLSAALLPFTLAVLDTLVPVFGGGAKTGLAELYDRIWGFAMSFFWPIGYWTLFVTQLAPAYFGRAPMRAIDWICHAWIVGLAVGALIGTMVYHIALLWVTPERLAFWLTDPAALGWLVSPFWDRLEYVQAVEWYRRFYPLWITSSLWLVANAVALAATLLIALRIGHRRARKQYAFNQEYEVLG